MAIYLRFKEKSNIKGEVTAKGYEDWIQCHSLQYGVGRGISMAVGSGERRESTNPSISEVTCTKNMDKSSAPIFQESLVGTGSDIEIHLVQTGADQIDNYLQLVLTDCLVSSYSVSSGGENPSESFSLNFTKIEMKYIPYDKDHNPGSPIPAGYDLNLGHKI